MRLVVASGKGGTGKTLVATNLAWYLAGQGRQVAYVDADVEAPNGHLFLHPSGLEETRFAVDVPALREGTCSGCGACQEACAFNAIIALPDRVMLMPELCHSCGACLISCDDDALVERPREVGTLSHGSSDELDFWSATLDVGEARAVPLIEGLLRAVSTAPRSRDRELILDAPPGTSCSAMAAVLDADLVLLVTEPTPFGFHDLQLAVKMCQALGRPVAALVNRADLGGQDVTSWLEREGVPILAEIPYSEEVAAAYARGELAARSSPSFGETIARLARAVAEVSP
jgi:MinD superfamily P-loop ATPase